MSDASAQLFDEINWRRISSLDYCTSIADGTHATPKPVVNGFPLYTSKNLTSSNHLDRSDSYNISPKDLMEINQRSFVGRYDILFGMIGTVGNPVVIDEDNLQFAVKNVGIFRFSGDYYRSLWFYYCLNSEFVKEQFDKALDGSTQKFVSLGMLRSFDIQMPNDHRITKRICDILTTVDDLIEQTEALIAKYKSIKQGMMHDLFTRGIDKTGKLRPPQEAAPELYKQSELGWIPKEWEHAVLSKYADVSGGVTLGRKLNGTATVELPYLRVANVQDGFLDLTEIKTINILRSEIQRYALESGDLLMTEGGDFDKLGRGTLWQGQISPCLHQNHIFRVRSNSPDLFPEYLATLTSSYYGRHYFLMCAKQTTNLASINSTQVKAFPLLLPKSTEQKMIAVRLDSVDVQIKSEQQQQKKHLLLKTGLMQNLLTGKVRVNVDEVDKELTNA